MNVLVIDHVLLHGLELAQRLAHEGHKVVYAPVWGPQSDNPFAVSLGRGIPGITVAAEGWMSYVDWADVATITGSEHRGHVVEYLREHGVPVCGPGEWQVRLELDRNYGREIMREAGMNPTNAEYFTDTDDLADFIRKHPKRYVLKIDQTARAVMETVVGQSPDGEDLIDAAMQLAGKIRFAKGRIGMYLEEFIPGTEIGVGGWFNGEEILGPLMVTYDGMGGFAYDFRITGDHLIDREKLTKTLKKYGYRGVFDINGMIADDSGEYRPVEWTPRWGNGTVEFMCHAVPNLGKLLHACATGGKAETLPKDIDGKIAAIINAKIEDGELTNAIDIVIPEGEVLPVFTDEGSFWAVWPTRTEEGKWMLLPVLGAHDRRVAAYVAIADTLNEAIDAIDELAGDAKVAGSNVEIGRAREDLNPRLERVYQHAKGNDWVRKAADESSHVWGRPLRSR